MEIRFNRRDPADDLDAALRTIVEFNRVIIAADAKVGVLLTVNGFAVTGLVATGRNPASAIIGIAAVVLAISSIVCMGYLAATLRPSLRGAGPGNWFCFPTFPTEVKTRPAVPELADHAWRQAATLAAIARRKYRRFGVALRWSVLGSVAFLLWFAVVLLDAVA